MKLVTYLRKIFLLLLVLNCSSNILIKDSTDEPIELFSIVSVESQLVEIKYITAGYINSIPPQVIKKEESYIYELRINLALSADSKAVDDPVYMHLLYNGHNFHPIKYDEELVQTADDIFPEYLTQIEVKKKGEIQITSAKMDLNGEIKFDFHNPFRTAKVKLE